MKPFPQWINRRLDPSSRLGEILFGLIMALGFTGAVRLGLEEPDNRELFVSILGCNIAWGIVDGVMYAMTELFERGRKARAVHLVLAAPNDSEALRHIDRELDGWLLSRLSPDERSRLGRGLLEVVRRETPPHPGIKWDDVLGGFAVAVLIILCTLPVVIPFLLVPNPYAASRTSNALALALLFSLGCWWGRTVGSSPWRTGLGLTIVGAALVLVTIALGG